MIDVQNQDSEPDVASELPENNSEENYDEVTGLNDFFQVVSAEEKVELPVDAIDGSSNSEVPDEMTYGKELEGQKLEFPFKASPTSYSQNSSSYHVVKIDEADKEH